MVQSRNNEIESPSFSEELKHYLALLIQWAWLLALFILLAGVLAYVINRQMTPIYQAVTILLVNEAPGTKAVDLSILQTSERLAKTYAEIMTTRPVLEGVVERLQLDRNVLDLRAQIQVQPIRDTQLIKVIVEDADPGRAANIANALFTEFAEQNQALQAIRYADSKYRLEVQLAELEAQIEEIRGQLHNQTTDDSPDRDRLEDKLTQSQETYTNLLQKYEDVRLTEAQTTSTVVQIEMATLPTTPIRPKVYTNTLIAVMVGLMLGLGIVFLVETLDNTLRTPKDVTQELNLPILGVIAHHAKPNDGLVTAIHPRSPVSEAFRALRSNIQFASVDKPLRTLLVTSPSPEDGKTSTAANLGVILAQSGRSVLVVDGDLRCPRIHQFLNLPNSNGVSDLFMQAQVFLDGSLQKTDIANLRGLTAGDVPPNPAELLGSEKMTHILKVLIDENDIVVIDSPPILAVTDAAVLAPHVDGVLLVVRPGVTKLAACKQAVEQLHRAGANLLGVVLNNVEMNRSRNRYGCYDGYSYVYQKYSASSGKKAASGKAISRSPSS